MSSYLSALVETYEAIRMHSSRMRTDRCSGRHKMSVLGGGVVKYTICSQLSVHGVSHNVQVNFWQVPSLQDSCHYYEVYHQAVYIGKKMFQIGVQGTISEANCNRVLVLSRSKSTLNWIYSTHFCYQRPIGEAKSWILRMIFNSILGAKSGFRLLHSLKLLVINSTRLQLNFLYFCQTTELSSRTKK